MAPPDGSAIGSPAVVASCADHVFVLMREADVGHVSRVAEVALVFGLEPQENTRIVTVTPSIIQLPVGGAVTP